MSPLAQSIYDVLRIRVPALRPELSYADLVAALPNPWNSLPPDGQQLADALGELVRACRSKELPAIAAMVIRHRERVPGPGYYPVAHPDEADDPATAMIAWGNELMQVRKTAYPSTL
jgi:hypothetical protein